MIQQKGVLQIESVGKERWARSGGHTYNWSQKTSLVTETYGQSVSVSAPPGAYQLAGFTRQLTKHFSLNGGLRFGLNSSAPTIGATFGFTVAVGGSPQGQ